MYAFERLVEISNLDPFTFDGDPDPEKESRLNCYGINDDD